MTDTVIEGTGILKRQGSVGADTARALIDELGLDSAGVYEAIAEGVKRAMWQMMTNATSAPCADFYQMVKDGTQAGIERVAPRIHEGYP